MEHGEVGRNGRLLALALAAALVATGLGLVGTPNAFDRRIAAVPFEGLSPGLLGLSRIVLQVHWLTDVVGGWLYGLACLAAALWLDRRYRASPARSRSR